MPTQRVRINDFSAGQMSDLAADRLPAGGATVMRDFAPWLNGGSLYKPAAAELIIRNGDLANVDFRTYATDPQQTCIGCWFRWPFMYILVYDSTTSSLWVNHLFWDQDTATFVNAASGTYTGASGKTQLTWETGYVPEQGIPLTVAHYGNQCVVVGGGLAYGLVCTVTDTAGTITTTVNRWRLAAPTIGTAASEVAGGTLENPGYWAAICTYYRSSDGLESPPLLISDSLATTGASKRFSFTLGETSVPAWTPDKVRVYHTLNGLGYGEGAAGPFYRCEESAIGANPSTTTRYVDLPDTSVVIPYQYSSGPPAYPQQVVSFAGRFFVHDGNYLYWSDPSYPLQFNPDDWLIAATDSRPVCMAALSSGGTDALLVVCEASVHLISADTVGFRTVQLARGNSMGGIGTGVIGTYRGHTAYWVSVRGLMSYSLGGQVQCVSDGKMSKYFWQKLTDRAAGQFVPREIWVHPQTEEIHLYPQHGSDISRQAIVYHPAGVWGTRTCVAGFRDGAASDNHATPAEGIIQSPVLQHATVRGANDLSAGGGTGPGFGTIILQSYYVDHHGNLWLESVSQDDDAADRAYTHEPANQTAVYTAQTSTWVSGWMDLGSADARKTITRIVIAGRNLHSCRVTVRVCDGLDYTDQCEETTYIPESSHLADYVCVPQVSGYYVQIEIAHSDVEAAVFEIQRIDIEFTT